MIKTDGPGDDSEFLWPRCQVLFRSPTTGLRNLAMNYSVSSIVEKVIVLNYLNY
jgi:hypothetical protein